VKNRKPLLVVIMAAILSLSILAGCTQAELGFWELNNRISGMNSSLIKGETYISFNMSGQELPKEYEQTLEMLEDLNVKYEVRMSQKPLKLNLDLEYKTGDSTYKTLTNVRLVDDYLYVEVQPLLNFVEAHVPALSEELKQANEALKDVEYIKIKVPAEKQYNYTDSREINRLALTFSNNLQQIFEKFETTIITKKGNTYTLELDAEKLLKTIKELAEYSLDNSDSILNTVKYNLEDIDEETLALMFNIPEEEINKEEILSQIEQLKIDINSNKDMLRAQIADLYEMSEIYQEFIKKSQLKMEITKKSDGKIGVKNTVDFFFEDPSGIKQSLFIVENSDVQEVDAVIVRHPQGNVLDLEEISK